KKITILLIAIIYCFHQSQFQNVPFWPISALGKNFNPRNTPCIPAVKIFTRLDLDQTETF
ncbi:MAG: hypothetical protein KJ882_05830, partial [Proteobacteria bacterium]|nr:hypothetical protein [Pseudomonadota bacterium]